MAIHFKKECIIIQNGEKLTEISWWWIILLLIVLGAIGYFIYLVITTPILLGGKLNLGNISQYAIRG